MQSGDTPVFKQVVLAGGGHTHALLIRKWAMRPLAGVKLILVSPGPETPYSGMLPGLVAGHYTHDEIHIDLVKLCRWASVRFIQSEVTGIDLENRQVRLSDRPALDFDILSIDTGSTPSQEIPGVIDHAIPIKPIAGFWQRWQSLFDKLKISSRKQEIAVVGGGAGSLEAILAMAWFCKHNLPGVQVPSFHLVTKADGVLPGYPEGVRNAASKACAELGVSIQKGFRVTAVRGDGIFADDGTFLATDKVFWCAHAGAPSWPAESGLACDDKGFIAVNACLQSASHANVFAAGDIAAMIETPRPKAGVYAVRQAPVLFENIRFLLLGKKLKVFTPQDRFLSLLTLGGKYATGCRGIFHASGRWVWRWKDHIDRKFMSRFSTLPEMREQDGSEDVPPEIVPVDEQSENHKMAERCAGCGGKIGPQVLSSVLTDLSPEWSPEDAVVQKWPATGLVQTIDQIRAPFDDPWLLGRVSVFHALNDLHAMNATPHSIQVNVTLPFAGRRVQQRELMQLLQGIESACMEEGAILQGGHSSEGTEAAVCVVANGIPGHPVWLKSGANRGDILVTNKPLGTGIVLAAAMRGVAAGIVESSTMTVMNTSNRAAAQALSAVNVSSCTDISGFGLLGHMAEMLAGSDLRPRLDLDRLPIQSGVMELADSGIRSSLFPQNAGHLATVSWIGTLRDCRVWPVLLDPQTSGGLLAAVRPDQLGGHGLAGFQRIGELY